MASALVLMLAWSPMTGAQDGRNQSGETAPPQSTPPAVAQRADQLLKQMGNYIGSADQFTFHADIAFDHVLPSGQKLQYAATEDVTLKRPSGVYVQWTGDLGDRQFWYNGTSVALYDPSTPFYASETVPAGIDEMLDKVLNQLDFSPPLADLLRHDLYGTLRGNLQFGIDLGVTEVNGRQCYTLAFVERDVDWQIWIDTGPQLVPCKLVITYKNQPAQPQFAAVFSGWNFFPRIADEVFQLQVPADAQKIPFKTVAAK
jgi:hypothetical protein